MGDVSSPTISDDTEAAGSSKAASEHDSTVMPPEELVQLSKTLSRLLASPSKKKDDAKPVHPNLLPFYLRLFSSTSPVVQHTTSASRRTLTDQIVSRERHHIGTLATKKAGLETSSGDAASNAGDKKTAKQTKRKKKKFGNITVPFRNIFERLDQQQTKAATDPVCSPIQFFPSFCVQVRGAQCDLNMMLPFSHSHSWHTFVRVIGRVRKPPRGCCCAPFRFCRVPARLGQA